MSKSLITLGVVALVAVAVGLWAIGTYTGVRNEGRHLELGLSAKYTATIASYGQDRLAFTDSLGVAREKRNALDKILVDAVSGRYNKPGGAQVDTGKLFSAVAEAYPDLSGLNVYDKIVDFIGRMRNKFAQDQAEIAGKIAAYNEWRTTGSFLHPWFVQWCGFPSDSLTVNIGGTVSRGQQALDMMSRPIVGNDTNQIFDSGVDQPTFTPEKK